MIAQTFDERIPAEQSEENPLLLVAGSKAFYPGLGPCLVSRIEKRVTPNETAIFHHLIALDGSRSELFIPVEKAAEIGVRRLVAKSEIPRLVARLAKTTDLADHWKQRSIDNARLFSSGSPFDLADLIGSITDTRNTRSLSVSEARMLGKARKLLICEITHILEEEESTVEIKVNEALNARIKY